MLLLDELTTFLDEADQAGVVKAVRHVVVRPATSDPGVWSSDHIPAFDTGKVTDPSGVMLGEMTKLTARQAGVRWRSVVN